MEHLKESTANGTTKRTDRANIESASASRELILNAAADLFYMRGYAETGIRLIAERVNIKTASLYYHFSSKDEILQEILIIGFNSTFQATQIAVERLAKDATPRQKIEAGIAGHLKGIHANITYTSANIRFRGQTPSEVDKVMKPLRQMYRKYWQGLFDEASHSGWLKEGLDVSMVRTLVIGMMNQTMTWFDPGKGSLDKLIFHTVMSISGIWADDREIVT